MESYDITSKNIKITNEISGICDKTNQECACILQFTKRLKNGNYKNIKETEQGDLIFGCQNGSRIIQIEIDSIHEISKSLGEDPTTIAKNNISLIQQSIISELGDTMKFLVVDHDISWRPYTNFFDVRLMRGIRKEEIKNL